MWYKDKEVRFKNMKFNDFKEKFEIKTTKKQLKTESINNNSITINNMTFDLLNYGNGAIELCIEQEGILYSTTF